MSPSRVTRVDHLDVGEDVVLSDLSGTSRVAACTPADRDREGPGFRVDFEDGRHEWYPAKTELLVRAAVVQ